MEVAKDVVDDQSCQCVAVLLHATVSQHSTQVPPNISQHSTQYIYAPDLLCEEGDHLMW